MITIAIRLRYDYDTTIPRHIRSDRNYDLRSIRLRYDYDEKLTCSFFARVESRRMEAGVVVGMSDCSRIVCLYSISQLRFDYDTTMIRRYHDAFDYDGSE